MEPVPSRYWAWTTVPPMSSAIEGVPPVVTTLTILSKVTVAVTVSLTLRRLFCAPLAEVSATAVTVAAEVSIVTVWLLLATLTLPARSTSSAFNSYVEPAARGGVTIACCALMSAPVRVT